MTRPDPTQPNPTQRLVLSLMPKAREAIPNRIEFDQIPTQPSVFKATVVSVATLMLAGLFAYFWHVGPGALAAFLETNVAVEVHLENANYEKLLGYLFPMFGLLGALCGGVGVLSFLRIGPTYQLLRAGLLFVYPAVLAYAVLVWLIVFSMRGEVEINGTVQDRATAILFWWSLVWPALAVGLYTFWLHVMLASRSVNAAYTRRQGGAMGGDRVLEDWRTHGKDPRARKSFYGSFTTHIILLIIIPLILQQRGCIEAYRVPKGSGNPVVALVKIVKPKKKKKKTLTLRPDSAILFDIPDLDDLEVDKQMEELTQARYEAAANANPGKIGKGGGKKGGWPEGSENARFRFIRLNHGGPGWDDGMHQTGADINFLRYFAQTQGFKKVANKGESHSIALLDKYPADGFPPFVYMTGDGNLGRVSTRDKKILRAYCLGGGMLIADAGSPSFGQHFRRFIREVFPDKQLLDIADDDMLFQLPYGFPNGAPPFWHHDGYRAQGIKHDGRWIVFYHPGDMNDAWKSPGYSDVTPQMKDAAMNLGVNLVYYSFNQWNDAVARQRK